MKVYVEECDVNFIRMFTKYGFELVDEPLDANLIQFTGGADVSPDLYGEELHPYTWSDHRRDEKEMQLFSFAKKFNIPMAGVCRGGQFLNVMNGGKLFQHVNNHGIMGTHPAIDLKTEKVIQVTSTHHQMMRPTPEGEVVCVAENISTFKEYMEGREVKEVYANVDTEVVYYPLTKSLCFQPHPEHHGADECCEYYFSLIQRFFGGVK